MQLDRLLYLISGHNADRLTQAERSELDHWAGKSQANRMQFEQLTDSANIERQLKGWDQGDTEAGLLRLKAVIHKEAGRKRRYAYVIASAILTVLCGIGIYIFGIRNEQVKVYSGDQVYEIAGTIKPGTNRATLTVDDGKVIDLDQLTSGTTALEDGSRITKHADGEISYEPVSNNREKLSYNSIKTPKGGQYTLRLPDGSKVWLNAASSLHYPTSMSQSKRTVELDGEAYFEVAPDKTRPFVVVTKTQNIEVLGTHFNVSSYPNDANITTTLLEGSVRVSNRHMQKLLKPGQQSIGTDKTIAVHAADMDLALAWKNDQIRFKSESIANILKQAARWYNIDVAYKGFAPTDPITGGISRKDNLDVLLRVLEVNGIHFSIEKDGNQHKLIIEN